LGGGEKIVDRGFGTWNSREFAPSGGGTAQHAAGETAQKADTRGSRSAEELVLFEEEGIQGVKGFGGFAGVKGGFGEEADRFFAERLMLGGSLQVVFGGGVVLAFKGGLALFQRSLGENGGANDGRA
jgi:hypothetical protein